MPSGRAACVSLMRVAVLAKPYMDGMKHFYLFTSNRMEELSAAFCRELLAGPFSSPLRQETAVIQSGGMMRWVSMEIARNTGVCANIRFVFPNRFLQDVLHWAFPDNSCRERILGVEAMAWAIMSILERADSEPELEPLLFYLKDGDSRKRYQLAVRIADTFDQYMVFRPDMILKWEKGDLPSDKVERWQAHLWRLLDKTGLAWSRAALWREIISLAEEESLAPDLFPERVFVFGISSLPKLHMQVLKALSSIIDIYLFAVNPCREYWGDILSPFELGKAEARFDSLGVGTDDRHIEEHNPLLASMGITARDFFDMINELDPQEKELFRDVDSSTMLGCIQNDILHNLPASEKVPVSHNDSSIMIFACHDPMREVEVLHDNLLDMFENSPGLAPEDVLVMAPDIEDYAPYISAVFEAGHGDGTSIPFTITDRSPRSASQVVKGFMTMLSLFRSRFELSAVLEILELPFVKMRFGISEPEFLMLSDWLERAGIRWGIDDEFKKRQGLPPFWENTWKAGIDNLVVGFAMEGDGERTVGRALPIAGLDGSDADTLEKFIVFWRTLVRFYDICSDVHSPSGWREILTGFVEAMFEPDDSSETQLDVIAGAINSLAREAGRAGFKSKVPLEVVTDYLESCFARQEYGSSFMAGGVTFCSMLPMRSIPFKVIYLLGMNMNDYPRKSYTPGFDLTGRSPRRGDRSKRNDDRYLFLETVFSARDRLCISYIGYNASDNSPRHPSVLVSELCDYISERFCTDSGKNVLDRIIISHRLQPFHSDYFRQGQSGLFSYAPEYRDVAVCFTKERSEPYPDKIGSAEEPDESWREVELEDLCRFFINPARFFLTRRLGMRVPETDEAPDDSEPFMIDGLEEYHVYRKVVENTLLEKYDRNRLRNALRARGRLPHGNFGDLMLDRICMDGEMFARKVKEVIGSVSMETVDIEIQTDGFTVYGSIDGVAGNGWFRFRYGRAYPKYLFTNWIYHLAISMFAPKKAKGTYIAKDKIVRFEPVKDSSARMKELLDAYWQGLSRPLLFFPESSFAYAEKIANGKGRQAALHAAETVYPERDDPFYRLCFGKADPLCDGFEDISVRLFLPLIENIESEKI